MVCQRFVVQSACTCLIDTICFIWYFHYTFYLIRRLINQVCGSVSVTHKLDFFSDLRMDNICWRYMRSTYYMPPTHTVVLRGSTYFCETRQCMKLSESCAWVKPPNVDLVSCFVLPRIRKHWCRFGSHWQTDLFCCGGMRTCLSFPSQVFYSWAVPKSQGGGLDFDSSDCCYFRLL